MPKTLYPDCTAPSHVFKTSTQEGPICACPEKGSLGSLPGLLFPVRAPWNRTPVRDPPCR